MSSLESLASLFTLSNKLKSTIRYESCTPEIREPVAGHCWQISFMVPLLAERLNLNLNVQHALEIAIIHDLGEYTEGKDFDSYMVSTGLLSKEDKDKSEQEAMIYLRDNFSCGLEIYRLWKEFQKCETPEARFVKALDKIESHFHFIERGCKGMDLDNLTYQLTYADRAVRNFPQLEPLLKIAKSRLRPLVEAEGVVWKEEYNYPD